MNGASAMTVKSSEGARRSEAEVVRELVPIEGGRTHGVTFDGERVWFAADGELVAMDPESGRVVRRHAVAGANAGTAFDGRHLYQIAGAEILVVEPSDGRVVRRIPAPGRGEDSGMAWGDGHLWVGQYRGAKIHKIDPTTGAIVKTLASDRFVTGVSCVDGALWHGASGDGGPSELRRLASDGTVEEVLEVPVASIAGVEASGDGRFWCAGEKGSLRLVGRAS
jgi:outer membrane protein assembly factor BamB